MVEYIIPIDRRKLYKSESDFDGRLPALMCVSGGGAPGARRLATEA